MKDELILIAICRYALHLVDTVKVGHEKAVLLTDGVKTVKDTLFFETNDAEDIKSSKTPKRPSVKPLTNGNSLSPAKNKTVAGKVLRTKTRSAAQVMISTAAKIKEHQMELHAQLQAEGTAKHNEDGGGSGGKEGKGWKRFQGYKGDAALPKGAESMKVRLRKELS